MLKLVLNGGGEFRAPKATLSRLGLFREHPELLELDEYRIRCDVSQDILDMVLVRVFGAPSPIPVTPENAVQLRSLCDELGFSEFDEDIRAVVNGGESRMRREVLDLRERVHRLEMMMERTMSQVANIERLLRGQADLPRQLAALEQRIHDITADLNHRIDEVSTTIGGRLDTSCTRLDQRIYEVMLEAAERQDDERDMIQQERNHRQVLERDMARIKLHVEKDLDRPLDGIIAQLTRRYGGNVHDKEAVEITASSDDTGFLFKKGPKIVANFDDGGFFATKNEQNSWICYHFKRGITVNVTSYSIASCYGNSKYVSAGSPKSWVLEGSNDGRRWTVLDRRENDYHLAAANYTVHNYLIVPAIPQRYSYLRISQTGKNHRGDYKLTIAALEFIGTIFQNA